MKQAKVIDGKKITTTDTAIHFKKLKSVKVGLEDYQKFLDDLAKNKKVDVEEIKKKLTTCGQPGLSTNVSTYVYWIYEKTISYPSGVPLGFKSQFDLRVASGRQYYLLKLF